MTDGIRLYLNTYGIVWKEEQGIQLEQFYHLVTEKNKVMNLTTITGETDFMMKHYIDSLSIVRLLKDDLSYVTDGRHPVRVIDVGTGAGFPGIPLKIIFPAWEIVLLDSLQKRVTFLKEAIDTLGLKGIEVWHGRAEEFGRDATHREQYDLCVSRAVANISTLSEYCLPFVKTGGCFVAYKAGDCREELAQGEHAIATLGGTISAVDEFTLPNEEDRRTLISIKKTMTTPPHYPRKAGTPAKKPID